MVAAEAFRNESTQAAPLATRCHSDCTCSMEYLFAREFNHAWCRLEETTPVDRRYWIEQVLPGDE